MTATDSTVRSRGLFPAVVEGAAGGGGTALGAEVAIEGAAIPVPGVGAGDAAALVGAPDGDDVAALADGMAAGDGVALDEAAATLEAAAAGDALAVGEAALVTDGTAADGVALAAGGAAAAIEFAAIGEAEGPGTGGP